MAEGHINTNKLPIQCPVCLETYNRPRTLPCLHTFCTSCLHGHISHSVYATSFSTFPCPVCRIVTKPPKPFTGKETWAEQFPVNYWILSIIEESEFGTIQSDPCCEIHKDCKINIYCSDHKKTCCATCVAISHRKCDHVDEISKVIEIWNKDTAMNDLLLTTKQTEDLFIDLDAKCVLAESNLHINKDKIASTIETEFEKVISHLNKLKDDTYKELEVNYKPVEDEIERRKKLCARGKQVCQEARELINEVDKNNSISNSFIDCQRARNKLDTLDAIQLNKWTLPEVNTIIFTTNREVDTIPRIQCLGKVENVTQNMNVVAACSAAKNAKEDEGGKKVACEEYAKNEVANSAVSIRTECIVSGLITQIATSPLDRWSELTVNSRWNNSLFQRSWISGSVFLNHGVLMMCNQSRASLCVVRESMFLDEEKRKTPPWSVSRVGDSCVVVTYPQENCVRIFDIKYSGSMLKLFRRPSMLGRSVVLQRSFNTEDPCFGVASTGDRVFLASEDSIKVLTLGGRCCQLLKLSLRSEPLFKRVVGLAFDDRHSTLYVTDEMNHTVLAFKFIEQQLMHQPVFEFNHELLRCPQHVAVGVHSEVFVCGFVSKTIHVLDRFGICTRILSLDKRPSCLSVNHKHRLILIGYYPEKDSDSDIVSDHVRIYKLYS